MSAKVNFKTIEQLAGHIKNEVRDEEKKLGPTKVNTVEDFQLYLIKMLAGLIITVAEEKS